MFFREPVQKRQFSRNTIETGTGKRWDEWTSILDGRNCRKKGMSDVMNLLMTEYNLSAAWARTIASYYVLQ